jgi:3',5'-cyclic AMP phosphodiesterase CpdA
MAQHWRQTSHDPAPLRAFVTFAYQNRHAIDAILVSGDLATSGDRPDLTAAYRLYTSHPANPGVCLTAASDPTLFYWAHAQTLDVLPGNHDRFGPARNLFRPGGNVFDRVFCPLGGVQLWSAGQGVAPGVAIYRGSWVAHLVKADFSLHRRDGGKPFYWLPGWFGQGRVLQTVLDQLIKATKRARDDITQNHLKPVTLWAIHFDPSSTDRALELLDSRLLAQQAAELDVKAILCGHTHETKVKPLSPKTLVYACGTVAQAGSPQWDFQIIEITTDDHGHTPPKISVRWYRFDKGVFSLLSGP